MKKYPSIITGMQIEKTEIEQVEQSSENYKDQPPVLEPNSANGFRILFDNTHGQTAGAADWVIDGGFSEYAEALRNEGYYVTELRKKEPILLEDLKNYDVFVLPEANIPYKEVEQNAMIEYVQKGGAIFFIGDHYNADRNKNRWDASEVFNGYRRGAYGNPALGMDKEEAMSAAMNGIKSSDWLASHFGVRFRYNAIGDVDATLVVDPKECFQITEGIHTISMHAGSTIAILNPLIAKGIVYLPNHLSKEKKWAYSVDDGIYNGGGIEEGAYVAIAKVGLGKAAFLGDSSAVEDATPKYRKEENGEKKKTYDGFSEKDNAKLLLQLSNWLAKKEEYETFEQINLPLDNKTILHAYEAPLFSTEPQKEPWGKPNKGYKWYDPTTYHFNAYGYEGKNEED